MNKPEQSILSSLLEKHALGICTREEMALLEQWYAAFPEQAPVWTDDTEKMAMKETLKAEIFAKITPAKVHSLTPVQTKRSRSLWWQAAAAAAILATTLLLYNLYGHKKEPVYVTVSAPAGKEIMKLQLPDQSEVWLEPGTNMRYLKDFDEGREIDLTDGMAYFSVRKDPKRPFLVYAPGGVRTKVLGTEFTVKAYRQSKEVQVMVSSGIVEVADSTGVLRILSANQQLYCGQFAHETKFTEGVLQDWRTGNIVLNNASFAEIARILENRYALQVNCNATNVAHYRFTLRISNNTTAADMLGMLKDISGLAYTLNGNKVTIH